MDSRLRGNDEIRGGLWVFAGGHRNPLPDQAGDRLLRLRSVDTLDNHGGIVPTPMRLPTRLSGEDLWFEILLVDDAGAASGRPDYEQTLFLGVDLRLLIGFQPGDRSIDGFLVKDGHSGRELP